MAKGTKTKTTATAAMVPQSRDEAARAITRIGELNRDIARRETEMNDEIAVIKARYEAAANPIRDEVTSLTDGVATWASAHRAALTGDGRTKTADLGTGRVSWRVRPPRVSIRDMDAVLDRLKSLGLHRFVRSKEEVNKEAMLAEPEAARGIVGVTIGSAGEDFIVEPFEADLQSTTTAA